MTDIPKTGFLCAGKTALELSASIYCAYKISDFLRSKGYGNSGYYTRIYSSYDKERESKTARILERLCTCCDLVLTVGCEGFSRDDIIPDVTDVMCEKRVDYFSGILCGGRKIKKPDEAEQNSGILRVFPDEKPRFGAITGKIRLFSPVPGEKNFTETEKKSGELKKINIMRIISDNSRRNPHFFERAKEETRFSEEYIEAKPSRASAGIMKNTLVLNFSNDVYTALPLVKAVLPAINFTVYNVSGKSAADFSAYKETVKSSINYDDFSNENYMINI
jgi:molybdopterin biosynthesis enzyme MoaB